ncbi:hypothetical protein BDV33DRAFT_105444 [Aspergillus novoparasiticus]|uniref:Zn(2)-C6 fungal-type domain-containing protein n=1 Tax=Aspergillus novoparasiticus TaxID=986946 RepID=A0A5N6ERI5_9EURO|nr:hypothetical protein BDV33DRAFT_105444 [Aspergillus novoparasiticus]
MSTMSNYYVGQFGRMLPAIDGQSSRRGSNTPASPPVPGSHPYQLPPPRSSAPLQLGTDPFLHQRNQGEGADSGGALSRPSPGHQQTPDKQLPSVSQLLTPTVHESRPPSPYRPHAFSYAPHNGATDPTHKHRPKETGPVFVTPRSDIHESAKFHSDPSPQLQPGPLPRLAHMSPHGLGHEPHFSPASQGSPSIPPFAPPSYSPQGFRSHERDSGDVAGSETSDSGSATNKSQSNVRPHVIDEKYIDGEGLCYIYADGSHCPKIIDGVPVNANWGITKAGKPRKRLAQACLTCREKKIKCQPNLPKCDQCQKSGRECRFESAPRGHRAALKASQLLSRYEIRDGFTAGHNYPGSSGSFYSMVRASESSTSLPGTSSQSPVSEGAVLTPSAMEGVQENTLEAEHQRRLRVQSLSRVSVGVEEFSKRPAIHVSPDYNEILMEMKDLDPQDPIACDWSIDPYEADPELTVHYIETFFNYINDRLYYMLPRKRFLLWLRSCHTKSLDDNMLLYSMMALGAVFSDRPDRVMALKRYSRTARYAVERSQHSLTLQLAQSRIIMSLWFYAIGALVKSWDAAGAAVRTVCGLRYNVESGGVIVDQTQQTCEYGLHPQALIECRRRTFWIAFMMDRLSSFYTPSSNFISSQSAYLRLPCREEVYEAQQYTTVPYFQNFLNQTPVSPEDELSGISAMALLIDVMAIWGDVSDHVFRLSLIPADAYRKLFEEFHSSVVRRSDELVSRLPDHLTFTAVNMERSIRTKKADTFVEIHLLYHATLMKLNRHARHRSLPEATIDWHVHTTRNHAAEILRISLTLMRYAAEYEPSRLVMEPATAKGTILSPYLGYVIVSAVDVLSAGGLMVDIPETITLIRGGLEALKELSRFWAGSVPLVSLVETRLDAMLEHRHHPMMSEGKVAFMVTGSSLDSQVRNGTPKQEPPSNEDLMYGGLPRERFFAAVGAGNVPFLEENILWIRDTS